MLYKKRRPDGHFLAGAYSGYTGDFTIPFLCYTYTNLYARLRHGEVCHTQDNLMSFGKGALVGSGLYLLKRITTAIGRNCATEQEKKLEKYSFRIILLKKLAQVLNRGEKDKQKDEISEYSFPQVSSAKEAEKAT